MDNQKLKLGSHWGGGTCQREDIEEAFINGQTAVQVFVNNPSTVKFPDLSTILDFTDDPKLSSLVKVIHGPYTLNLCNDPNNRMGSDVFIGGYLKSAAVWASRSGAFHMVFHVGSYKSSKEKAKEHLERRVRQWLRNTVMSNVVLCLENDVGGGHRMGGIRFLAKLVRSVGCKRLKVCLDTAHAYASGVDFNNDSNRLLDRLESYRDVIEVVHINQPDPDVICGKNRDRHNCKIEEGPIDVKILERIARIFKDKVLIVEASSPEVALHNVSVLKQMLES